MWVEVSVPYVDIVLEGGPKSPGFKARIEAGLPLRLYYSQILWVDQIKTDDQGKVRYRVNERFGYGDLIWAAAEAFRPLTQEELAPISPGVGNKMIVINVEEKYQTLSCLEGKDEVYFCRISAGKKYDAEGNYLGESATPKGTLNIWRKQVSTHMSGGTTGAGYDLPGIAWTSIFATGGVAIHSTFWHNNYGDPVSHGCVNCSPEDAKWIFRWATPNVVYDPGMVDVTISGDESTSVEVVEG
jgi:lipoprotein-anchoring transpeptidase ErfK/SrfK